MKKHLVCGYVLSVLAVGLASPMPLRAATIRSTDIVAADGTSGQVLTTGNGVKTGHIQNLAITGAKIAAGTITSGNIGNSQIINTLLAPNAVTTDKIQDGAVGNADLASGAVTDAKITGPISAAKISSTGLNADTVDGKHAADLAPVVHTHNQADVTGLAASLAGKADVNHNHDAIYQRKYANTVVVAKSGGDFTDPIAAINSITNSSASNPYLLKIMPGTYDLGSNALYLKNYVDVEGSGENVTLITSSVTGGNSIGTVNGANNAEIRFLSIANTGGGDFGDTAVGLVTSPSAIGRLTNLTVSAQGSYYNYGILNLQSFTMMTNVVATAMGGQVSIGVDNNNSPSTMTNVSVSVSGAQLNVGVRNTYAAPVMTNVSIISSGGMNSFGVWNYESSPVMSNLTAIATGGTLSYGMVNDNNTVSFLDGSKLEGTTNSLVNAVGCTARIGASKLKGAVDGLGSFACVASYDGDYAPLGASCQ